MATAGVAAPPPREPTPLLKKAVPTAPTTSVESPASTGPTRGKSRGATGHAGQQEAATPAHQRPGGPPQPRRAAARAAPGSDPLSERATTLLIRRTLCPQQGGGGDKGRSPARIEDLLPPLTSRNDVDLQLYAIIAIVLRDFVQTWYGKITPDDDFVAEIVQIVAHCTRALEQRLRKVDLESLLLDELPELLSRHIDAYRIAHRPMVRPPLDANAHHVYHSLWPTPALSPVPSDAAAAEEQAANESAYRQLLVEGVLAVLLPTEDLENPCLTALVGQVLSELIIGGVIARKLSEPWLIWELMASMARGKGQEKRPSPDAATTLALTSDSTRQQPPPPTPTGKPSATPPTTTTTTAPTAALAPPRSRPMAAGWAASLQRLFWSIVHMGFLAFALLRALVVTLATYRSVPSRLGAAPASHGGKGGAVTTAPWAVETPTPPATAEKAPQPRRPSTKVPVAAFRIWTAASNLLEVEARMPWLRGCLSLAQWMAIAGPGQLAGLDGPLDRLVSHAITRHLLNPAKLPPLLRALRGAMFPNNTMGTQSLFPPSSEQELLALRRRSASSLRSLIPNGVRRLYFGSGRSNIGGTQSGKGASTLLRTGPDTGGDASPPDHNPESQTGPTKPPPGQQKQQRQATSNLTGASSCAADHMSTSRAGATVSGSPAATPGSCPDDERIMAEIESGILDVFGDAYCNKHLMYGVLELLLVRLMPELADRGVVDLWAERLS